MASKLQQTLAKLKATQQRSGNGEQVPYFKPAQGKNELIIVGATDDEPFMIWKVISGLKQVPFHTVSSLANQTDEHGNPLSCPIEEYHTELKQDFKANLHLIKRLQFPEQVIVPVLDVNDLAKGLQYWRTPKAFLDEVTKFLENVDEDNEEAGDFWNINSEAYAKVIIDYDKNATAIAKKYAISLKPLKAKAISEYKSHVLTAIQNVKPIEELMKSSTVSREELLKLLEEFKVRAAAGEFDAKEAVAEESEDGKVNLPKKKSAENDAETTTAGTKKRSWEEDDSDDDDEE